MLHAFEQELAVVSQILGLFEQPASSSSIHTWIEHPCCDNTGDFALKSRQCHVIAI